MKTLSITEDIYVAIDSDLDDLPTPSVSTSTEIEPTPSSGLPLTPFLCIQKMRGLVAWTKMPKVMRALFMEHLDWLNANIPPKGNGEL